MAINFPDSPTTGQIYGGYIWSGVSWNKAPISTALPKNMILNGGMLISQQNGSTASTTVAALSTYYPADGWVGRWSLTGSTMNITRWDGQAPTGSKTIYLANIGAVITPAASDYALITQKIEGYRMAELMWGTSKAIDAVFRMTVAFNTGPGTYHVRFANADVTRSYVAPFYVPGGWNDIIVPIPGDTTGTWLADTGIGMWLDITMAIGSNYHGVAGWQAGNKYATSAQFNGCSVTGGSSNFHVSSVGLYADPYKTGVPPPYALPDYATELRRCQRHWYKAFGLHGGASSATAVSRMGMRHQVPLRVAPVTANVTIAGAPRVYDGGVTAPITSVVSTSNNMALELDVTCSAGTFTAGRAAQMYYQTENDYLAVNVRL